MKSYRILGIALAVIVGIDALSALLGLRDLSVYFIIDSIAFLVVTLAHVNLDTKVRSSLNAISSVMFVGFIIILALKVIQIMQ